ncbi:phosphoribosylformylglycinamidine synthase subunit PurQ [Leptolinea sp. HRD-7]|nr:phosphoribosylformylglycinamidine synthase subunit PurQ [Leptolinea sp. HRD-7]
MKPRAMILFAPGINRDHDVATALEMAGAETFIYPVKQLFEEKIDWAMFQMLVVPGGFSYADALGAGRLLALDLNSYFTDEVSRFLDAGKPAIGICNGFQALVKAGILPDRSKANEPHKATLTFNQSNHFECRWVTLKPVSQTCVWTRGLDQLIDCPVAHGEGNFKVTEPVYAQTLVDNDQIALVYTHSDGKPALGAYPQNPNGSVMDIAGVCNRAGNVLGLMPHPENNILAFQTPDRANRPDHFGLPLFVNGVRYASQL